MTTIFSSLEIAKRALLAHQLAQQITGHNVSNVNTPGFSRQRAELTPLSISSPPFTLGAGVDVAAVRRIRDRFIDFQLLGEQQALGRNQAQETVLKKIEAIFNEPQGGGSLGTLLDQFFQSLHDLAIHPTESATRVAVVQQGTSLALSFRQLRGRLDQVKSDLEDEIDVKLRDANSLIDEIATLNQRIAQVGDQNDPNDLMDQRDLLVNKLGQLVGVTVLDRTDGTVQVALAGSGVLLVDGTLATQLTAVTNLVTDTVDVSAGSVAVTPQSGEVSSLLNARNSATGPVKQAVTDLDSLAREIIEEVNRVHANGAGLTGYSSATSTNAVSGALVPLTAAGLPFTPVTGSFDVIVHDATGAVVSTINVPITAGLTTLDDVRLAIDADPNLTASIAGGLLTVTAGAGFTFAFANDSSDTLLAIGLNSFFTGSDALTIDVNSVVSNDITKVAAARADATGLVHGGDGSNALAMAQLSTALTMSVGTATFNDFYGTMISDIGAQARDASQSMERQQTVVNLLENLQQQTSGVSLDEEMTNLIQQQHAYEAAARYVTVMNQVLDSLLNMI